MAEQVVQVTREALALAGDGGIGELGARGAQLLVADAQIAHQDHQQADPERGDPVGDHGARPTPRRWPSSPRPAPRSAITHSQPTSADEKSATTAAQ